MINNVRTDDRNRILPTLNSYVGDMSDHHIFRINNIPYLFLTCGRWQHYHRPTDTPEKLNYIKMEAISNVLHSIITECDTASFSKGATYYDTTKTELLYINTVFSDLLKSYRIPKLQSREGIDRLVQMLFQKFRV